MKDWANIYTMHGVPPQGHLQGQTRDIQMSYHILFEGVCFVQSYSTHIWNTYIAGNLLKIKIREK